MEQGCVVITNLDEHSPPTSSTGSTCSTSISSSSLPTDQLELRRLSVAAMETARAHSWAALAAAMGGVADRRRALPGGLCRRRLRRGRRDRLRVLEPAHPALRASSCAPQGHVLDPEGLDLGRQPLQRRDLGPLAAST